MSERARYKAVTTVLVQVLFLNIAVALAKLVLGYLTGAVSVVSDGLPPRRLRAMMFSRRPTPAA